MGSSKNRKFHWVVSEETYCAGDYSHNEFSFTSKIKARKKMLELIKCSKRSGILARYIRDVGTKSEKEWEITNGVEHCDFFTIDGYSGDYFASFRLFQKPANAKIL